MKTKNLQSWDDFEIEIQELLQYREKLKNEFNRPDILVFRGQPDANWCLETTLERESRKNYSMSQYFEVIKRARPKIEPIRGVSFETLDLPEYSDWYMHKNFLWPNGLEKY